MPERDFQHVLNLARCNPSVKSFVCPVVSQFDNISFMTRKHDTIVLTTSVYCFTSAANLRDYVRQYLDANDRLLVVAFIDWASRNALIDINKI